MIVSATDPGTSIHAIPPVFLRVPRAKIYPVGLAFLILYYVRRVGISHVISRFFYLLRNLLTAEISLRGGEWCSFKGL